MRCYRDKPLAHKSLFIGSGLQNVRMCMCVLYIHICLHVYSKRYWGETILSPQNLGEYWGESPCYPCAVGAYDLAYRNRKLEISTAPTKAKSRKPAYSQALIGAQNLWIQQVFFSSLADNFQWTGKLPCLIGLMNHFLLFRTGNGQIRGSLTRRGGQRLPLVSQVNRMPNSHASFRRQLGNNLLSRVVTGRRLSLDYRPRPTSRPLFLGCCSTVWSQYLTVYSRPSVFRWPAPLTFCVNASQNSSRRNLR